jgi:hypothetical protein
MTAGDSDAAAGGQGVSGCATACVFLCVRARACVCVRASGVRASVCVRTCQRRAYVRACVRVAVCVEHGHGVPVGVWVCVTVVCH